MTDTIAEHASETAAKGTPLVQMDGVGKAYGPIRALEGINRMHAIFGWSEKCVAVYPSDMAIALAAVRRRS